MSDVAGGSYAIPRYGGKGVGFVGVELSDAWIFVGSCVIAFMSMFKFGYWSVFFAVGGYLINKEYLEWKRDKTPDHLRTLLYIKGLLPYSLAFNTPNKIFIGDAVAGSACRAISFDNEHPLQKIKEVGYGDQ